MNLATLTTAAKNLILKKPGAERQDGASVDGGRRRGENENPYLAARRTWNSLVIESQANRQMWQIFGILALMIALAAVGGLIHLGSQSKFIPYVVEVDRNGGAIAVAPAQRAAKADPRVVHASVACFVSDLRTVTPDIALQRKAIYRIYSMLSSKDPATAKANEWLNGSEESSPFKRAETETVSVEISSVLPQTPDTWQVDWVETVYDRQGLVKGQPYKMRALITVYLLPPSVQTTEEQVRNNPLGTYIRDFSWSRQL